MLSAWLSLKMAQAEGTGRRIVNFLLNPSVEKKTEGVFKLIIFGLYVLFSISFVIDASVQAASSKACLIRNTYRQEFLSKVQSNPYYTSTNIYRPGPTISTASKNGGEKQLQSDIVIFPVMHVEHASDSAFLTRTSSTPAAAAAQAPPVSTLYLYNASAGKVQNTGMLLATLSSMLTVPQTLSGDAAESNLQRCLFSLDSATEKDVELQKLLSTSHRAGTCLLTAQQAMVDISSNYRTSLVLFSSVNLLFMVWVVLWISSSFALFYFGEHALLDALKEGDEYNNAPMWRKAFNFAMSSDFIVGLCVVWNGALVVMMWSNYSYDNHVPINNAMLAALATLLAIAKQMQWANFSYGSSTKAEETADTLSQPVGTKDAALKNEEQRRKEAVSDLEEAESDGIYGSSPFTTNFFFASAARTKSQKSGYQKMQMHMLRNGKFLLTTGGKFTADEYMQDIQVTPFFPFTFFHCASGFDNAMMSRQGSSPALCKTLSIPSPHPSSFPLLWQAGPPPSLLAWSRSCLPASLASTSQLGQPSSSARCIMTRLSPSILTARMQGSLHCASCVPSLRPPASGLRQPTSTSLVATSKERPVQSSCACVCTMDFSCWQAFCRLFFTSQCQRKNRTRTKPQAI